MRDDQPELRRDDVKPLRRLLADHMHRRAAAGAVGIFWRNRHVDVRQMGRKCAAIGASLISALACARKVLLVLSYTVLRLANDEVVQDFGRAIEKIRRPGAPDDHKAAPRASTGKYRELIGITEEVGERARTALRQTRQARGKDQIADLGDCGDAQGDR